MNANVIKLWRIGICRGCRGYFRKLTATDDLCNVCRGWDGWLRQYAHLARTPLPKP